MTSKYYNYHTDLFHADLSYMCMENGADLLGVQDSNAGTTHLHSGVINNTMSLISTLESAYFNYTDVSERHR